jgi:diacylglycerol kinase (ATP)
MSKTGTTGFKRVWNALFFSLSGISAAWRNESAFRQESVLAILLTPVAFWLGQSITDHALLLGSLLIVLIVELLNSAIEAVVDRVGTDRHRLSGQAKDMGSAAVFFSLLLVALIWGLIAWQRFGANCCGN